jgi:hypothetical protein
MIKSVISLIIALHLTVPVAKDISLSYNLKVSDRFELRQKTDQKIVQTVMGMNQTGNNAYDGTIDMRVVSIESDRIRIEAKMTRLKSHIKNFLNEITLDSDGEVDDSSRKIVRAIMNQPFFVTLSKAGKIEKVEGVENLWAAVDKLDVPEEDKDKVKATMGQMINESSFKNGLGQAFLMYAGRGVQPKETWTTESGIPADFPVRATNTWFVESVTGGQAIVNGDGIFKTTDKEKIVTLPGGEMKAKVDLSGTQKVKGVAMVKTGLPENVAIDGKLSGTILLLAGGMLPMDIEVPISIETHTDYTFSKK